MNFTIFVVLLLVEDSCGSMHVEHWEGHVLRRSSIAISFFSPIMSLSQGMMLLNLFFPAFVNRPALVMHNDA